MSLRLRHITRMISILILLLLVSMSLEGAYKCQQDKVGLERDIMARGAPDYSNVKAASPLHRLDDMAELAARLGSPVVFNREGSVVWVETFQHGWGPWWTNAYGTGGEVAIASDIFRSGPFSAKLTAGSDGSAAAKIYRIFPYPTLTKFGLEASWYPGTNVKYADIVLARTDGTDEHQAYVRYDDTASEIQIKDENGDFVTIVESLDLTPTYASFHTFKVVGDFDNDLYLRLIVNSTAYDLSDYALYVFANADPPGLRVDLKLWGVAATNGYMYYDDIILTQNEP